MPDPNITKQTRSKVLLIGWDAADWKVARPLMAAGKMPNLRRLVESGCSAPIATLQPSFSPMLWTSIATGKRPVRHGIHGFTEPRPDGRGVHRVTNLSRKCKALWNILGQEGKRSIVVGWWPSYPAEPINGVMVSDQFHRVAPDFKLTPGILHPPELGEALAALRLNPEDLAADAIEFFVPNARDIDQTSDRRLISVARVICECANIHTAATWLMEREPWDLCAVYFDAIDHFGHGFMKYNPPRQDWIDEAGFALYQNVVRAGYQLHDRMLGTLLEKAGSDATVILLSDHGFHPDHLRPAFIPKFHAGPAVEHRNNGIFVIAGPGIRRGEELCGVNLLDIAPTVLSLFGLPVGDDMDGVALSGAFEGSIPAVRSIPSWETVEGDDGRHAPHMQLDPLAASESLEQLVALGYVEEPDADDDKAVKLTITDLRINLAEAYQDDGRHTEAATILRELRGSDHGDDNKNDQRIAVRLFLSAVALRRTGEMVEIANDWSGRRKELYQGALERINELHLLLRGKADTTGSVTTQHQTEPDYRAELKKLRRLCYYDPSVAVYLQGEAFRAQRRWQAALDCLDSIPVSDLLRSGLHVDRAGLLARLGRWEEAECLVVEALAIDPDDARAHFMCCRLALHREDFAAAERAVLSGLALLDRDPFGHYLLGVSRARLGHYEAAATAFQRAIAVNPNFPLAHLWLARMYRGNLADPENAVAHSQVYQELTEPPGEEIPTASPKRSYAPAPRPVAFAASARDLPPIADEAVVVTGLPRSGTSMLMQMLVAGGLMPLTDGLRQPDEDNPRGYFEFEPVKQMSQDAAWFDEARGKVVKVVAPMIQNVPDGVPCRVILIEREVNEILASQYQMIARLGRGSEQSPDRLKRLQQEYLRLIVWTKGFLAGRPGTKLMCVNRNAILRDPEAAAAAINRFLGGNLDTALMAAEVKPELHRQRSDSETVMRNTADT